MKLRRDWEEMPRGPLRPCERTRRTSLRRRALLPAIHMECMKNEEKEDLRLKKTLLDSFLHDLLKDFKGFPKDFQKTSRLFQMNSNEIP